MGKLSRKSISILAATVAVVAVGSSTAISLHKTVELKVNGQSKDISGFITGSVKDFLHKQGVSVTAQDFVQPGIDTKVTEGMHIEVTHARTVKIQDGVNPPKELTTVADTVANVLKQSGIALGDQDRINVELTSTPIDGQTITITRREIKVSVTEEAIPFQTERQPKNEMYKGQESVLTRGVEGLAKVTTRTVIENGAEIDRRVQKEVVKEPVNSVVAYGTQNRPIMVASRGGGNFTASQKLTMNASAYVAGGRTASGVPAQVGVAAVDPNVIPIGTKLYVEGYGYAVAADTGGAIKGSKIDLVFNSQQECLQFGRRQVVVYILP